MCDTCGKCVFFDGMNCDFEGDCAGKAKTIKGRESKMKYVKVIGASEERAGGVNTILGMIGNIYEVEEEEDDYMPIKIKTNEEGTWLYKDEFEFVGSESGKITNISNICDSIKNTLEKKNADYGSSATDTYKKYGVTSYLTRFTDKMNRLDSLLMGDKEALVEDEKIEDTILDLAGYAILMLNDIKEHGIIKSNKTKEE